MPGFLTNVGARIGGRPGLFTPAGYNSDDPIWSSGDEFTYPRWELFRDEWGWNLTGWSDSVTFVEFRLASPVADLNYESSNTFYLEWSTGGLWTTPTTVIITLEPSSDTRAGLAVAAVVYLPEPIGKVYLSGLAAGSVHVSGDNADAVR